MLRILVFLLASTALMAQYGVARKALTGSGAPSSTDCNASNEVGNIYARNNAGAAYSTFYVCANTAANTYAWELYGTNGASLTGGTGITIAGSTINVNTAVIQSRAAAQSGVSQYCASSSGNDTYVCALDPALTAYTAGGCLVLNGDTANTGAATINVNALGAKSILSRSGAALSNGDITASKPITLCYDGTQYIIQGDGGGGSGVTYSPTRTSGTVLDLPAIATGTMAVGTYACGAVSASTFTVSSGTGTIWVALANDCTVAVRHNIVGSCSAGCTAVSSSSGFLASDLPLYEWVVTAGSLAGSGTNKLIPNMSVALAAGSNVSLSTSNGVVTISASGGSFPPLTAESEAYDYEDFVSGQCQTNLTYNFKLGWQINSNAGGESVSCTADVATNHPGVVTITTASGSGNDGAVKFLSASLTPADTFTYRALIKLASEANVKATVALTDDNFNNVSTDGCYFEKLEADSNWFAACMSGGVASTRQDTGVAAGTGWIAFQIQRTSGSNIAFKTATTLGGLAGASALNITTQIPTVNIRPAFFIESRTGATKAMAIDFADLRVTGMTR